MLLCITVWDINLKLPGFRVATFGSADDQSILMLILDHDNTMILQLLEPHCMN